MRVSARDTIGRTSRAAAPLTVSRALVSFSADTKLVSPNGDGRRDTVTFGFGLAQPAVATLSLVGTEATFPIFTGELAPGLQSVTFAGAAADGSPIPDGQYQATIAVGAVKLALPLTIDNTPPVVTLVSTAPLMLRVYEQVTVDRDGERQADQGEQEGRRVRARERRVRRVAERRRAGRGGQRVAPGHVSGETEALTHAVVTLLELLEDRREQLSTLDRSAFQCERGRRQARLLRELQASVCATLTPAPRTTLPSAASARIPATFLPRTSTSFGGLTFAESPVCREIAAHTASAARTVSSGSRSGSTAGVSTIEKRRPASFGASHTRPSRPRPAVCSSAATTAPSGAPSSMRWVDAHASNHRNGTPNRPRGTSCIAALH